MMRAHQPGSRPLDIPEAIPNPAVPQTTPSPSPSPREPVKVPAPQRAARRVASRLAAGYPEAALPSSFTMSSQRSSHPATLINASQGAAGGGTPPVESLRADQLSVATAACRRS
jgi:hypothetical protein